MIELRSRARTPSAPMISAATSEPTMEPSTTLDPGQQCCRRAGERQLADAVHGEGQVAHHDERADQPAHHAEHGAGDDGVVHQARAAAP